MPTPIIIVLLFLCQTIKNYDGRSTGCKGSVRALVSAIVLVACTEGARVALMTEAGAHILGGGRGGGGVLDMKLNITINTLIIVIMLRTSLIISGIFLEGFWSLWAQVLVLLKYSNSASSLVLPLNRIYSISYPQHSRTLFQFVKTIPSLLD